ncbi:hypothetical protein ACA910_019482 [Epithemia clementina (nom. ined.)]
MASRESPAAFSSQSPVVIGNDGGASVFQPAFTSLSEVGAPLFSARHRTSTATAPLFSTVADTAATKKTIDDYVKDRGGNLVIRKVLIANNGMAATKAIFSMRQWAYMELGDERAVQFVAMASPEDIKANAEFIRLAESFVEVPGGKNSNNYANVPLITKLAQETGADAVWPGWGHASEKPELPDSLAKIGVKFIGPTAPVMSALGDKIAANILAQTAQVPSIPWSGSYGGPDDGPLQADLTPECTIPDEIFRKATCTTVEEAIQAAERIGYEEGLMIEASEGGGGKGIRFVDNEEDLRNAFIQVQNEVVGSPIFVMQLCKNARHLEVQIVGDQHGNAVALNGRDCSTQRRFQKIFEEGPPTIAKPETFKKMQLAAQRLTQSIGYQGAGTVEYLYNAATDKYFFLELNPRLQVGHPVTGITDVNMPATQLQVAMGIPLYNIPQIRSLYGRDDIYGTDPIDFMEEEYKPIKTHVIAARITAENPDEGFKPTSGIIERLMFQSTNSVWGYFSVGANGGIHEFADSQFGHLFAKGANREQARKALIFALKQIEVRGEISTTVAYLVQLLETKEFIENTVDTSWLDGLICEKSVSVELDKDLTVVSAAVFRAFHHVKEATEELKESFRKGQVSVGAIPAINSFDLEVAYDDVKYPFHVERKAPDTFILTCGESTIKVQVTENAEGSLIAKFGGAAHRIVGMHEPLVLRLVVDGNTVLMPEIFDPSELRTDVTGKVVRYLQENGGDVEAGQPYVEVEAMKMIMALKSSESGKITHTLSPGSVISAGDMLASLELKDPSKVKKIGTFEGKLSIDGSDEETSPMDDLKNLLAGFSGDAEVVAQRPFDGVTDPEEAAAIVTDAFTEFLRVETIFAGKLLDDVVRDLTQANADNLQVVIADTQAHQQLCNRARLMLAMLRQVELVSDRFGAARLPEILMNVLGQLAELKDKVYGEIALAADELIRQSKVPSFESRAEELRAQLNNPGTDLIELSKSSTLSAGVDLLTSLFTNSTSDVKMAAMEVYVRRVYQAQRILDLEVTERDGRLTCFFTFQFADVEQSEAPRHGILSVVPSFDALKQDISGILENLSQRIDEAHIRAVEEAPFNNFKDPQFNMFLFAMNNQIPNFAAGVAKHGRRNAPPLSMVHVAIADGKTGEIKDFEDLLVEHRPDLGDLGVQEVDLLIPNNKKDPSYFTFPENNGFVEDPIRRNVRPRLGSYEIDV